MENSENNTVAVVETINHINEELNEVYPDSYFIDRYNEMLERAMEDPDYQEQAMRMVQFYGI